MSKEILAVKTAYTIVIRLERWQREVEALCLAILVGHVHLFRLTGLITAAAKVAGHKKRRQKKETNTKSEH